VFALVGAFAVAFMSDIGSAMEKTNVTQHIRDIHSLTRATLHMADALKAINNTVAGGAFVIKGAFPRGEVRQINNTFKPVIGASMQVDWNSARREVSMINSAIAQKYCIEILMHTDVSAFQQISITSGAHHTVLNRLNWPITLAVAAASCTAADATIHWLIKL